MESSMRPMHVPMTMWVLSWHIWLMPGSAHMSCIVAMEVAMPACGLFIIDDAMAAPPIVVLAGDMAEDDDRAFAVAKTMFAVVEEVEEVLVGVLGMLAMSMFASMCFRFLD